jgi:hypothetical protein
MLRAHKERLAMFDTRASRLWGEERCVMIQLLRSKVRAL